MQENVGGPDLAARVVAGPALISWALGPGGARRGRTAGLAALVAGALVVESAITRTCPLNALVGRDTR
jgi:hypothetical protein